MRWVLLLCCLASPASARAEERSVYPLPPASSFAITSDVVYDKTSGQNLMFDLYRPRDVPVSRDMPVVVFLNGIGATWIRKHVQYSSWAKLVTTADLAGVTMDSRPNAIEKSFDSLVSYFQTHARELGIDPGRMLIYACSSNVSAALPIVMASNRPYIKGAIIYYGSGEASSFRLDLPVFYVRAGLDEPMLNRSIDVILARALVANAPFTVINFSGGHHGFELRDDTDEARSIVTRTLEFMRTEIKPGVQATRRSQAGEASAAAALAAKKWDAAVAAYSQLSAKDPKDAELHRKLGDALAGGGRFREALDHYQRAFDLGSPNRGLIAYAAAVAAAKNGQSDRALSWIEKLKGIPVFRARVLSEPAFVNLRDNPRFRALVEQF